jgi:nucleotide-binding universal stress UspA family protein
MKRILVPCDFSAPSREAFKMAIDIAAKATGEIIVLHTIYDPVMYDPTFTGGTLAFDPTLLSQLEEDAKKALEKLTNEFAAKKIKTRLEISYNGIVPAILQLIGSRKIDLIVMGTAGASGFQEFFIGSNTEKVVRHATVPVIAVRTAPKLSAIKRILLPTTLELNQTEFISKVKELQEFFNATLDILLINTPIHFRRDADALEALEEFARHYKLKGYKLHFRNYWNEEDGIIDFAYTEGMHLVAMATHGRKGLAHLFNRSITEDVVNHILYPVWTYHIKP